MAITVNGSSASYSYGSTATPAAITHAVGGTSQSNALMIAQISYADTTSTRRGVTSVTDSQGNTWQKLDEMTANSGWATGSTVNGQQRAFSMEIWYCMAATINASIDVTIVHSGAVDIAVVNLSAKYLGYDASHPFDLNVNAIKKLTNAAAAAETLTGISTDTAHIYPLWFLGTWGTSLGLSNVSFNGVNRSEQVSVQKNGSEFMKGQYAAGPAATSAYSSVTFTSPTSAANFHLMSAVLTADAQSVVAPKPANVTNIVITN